MQHRIYKYSNLLGFEVPIAEIKIGTIHSICNHLVQKNISHCPLQQNYEILDELKQGLFVMDHFDAIVKDAVLDKKYLGRWGSKLDAIKKLTRYFNRMNEELINIDKLSTSGIHFLEMLSVAFQSYIEILYRSNKIDFGGLQKITFEMLHNLTLRSSIQKEIRYIMIDEYQDITYVQEQIFVRLSEPFHNICAVGDANQSLYRFRGALGLNISRFNDHFKDSNKLTLRRNYRSHPTIVRFCSRLLESVGD
jgi:DNA helicase II / ATP-dependent DNA helicase PcrA